MKQGGKDAAWGISVEEPKRKSVRSEGKFIITPHSNCHVAIYRANYTSADANSAHTRYHAQIPLSMPGFLLPSTLFNMLFLIFLLSILMLE